MLSCDSFRQDDTPQSASPALSDQVDSSIVAESGWRYSVSECFEGEPIPLIRVSNRLSTQTNDVEQDSRSHHSIAVPLSSGNPNRSSPLCVEMCVENESSAPSSPFTSSPSLPPASCPNVVIRPRRSHGRQLEDKDLEPITITIEVLEPLYCKQLSEAAKTLGISVTALKRVCRNLGVRSWPFRFQNFMMPSMRQLKDEHKQADPQQGKGTAAGAEAISPAKTKPPESSPDALDIVAVLEMSRTIWGEGEVSMDVEGLRSGGNGWLVFPLDPEVLMDVQSQIEVEIDV